MLRVVTLFALFVTAFAGLVTLAVTKLVTQRYAQICAVRGLRMEFARDISGCVRELNSKQEGVMRRALKSG